MHNRLGSPSIRQKAFWGIVGVSAVFYFLLYFGIERHQTLHLLTLYTGLFTLYFFAYKNVQTDKEIRFFIVSALLLRLIGFGGMPTLSDDVYRFLWDGYLLNADINPFVQIPSEYIQQGQGIPGITPELYARLNSPGYHTVYPPFCQFTFWLATKLFPNSWFGATTFIRALIFLAELGTISILGKLLARYRKPAKNVLLYALNPLAILEFTGNLHFEAFVIFFLLAATYALKERLRLVSAFFFGAAVVTKLLPLIFLPLLLRRLQPGRLFTYYFMVALTAVASFLPFMSRDFIIGIKDSLSLYFQTFEFNASIYYLVREVGYWVKGYNIIGTAGKALAALSFLSIMAFSILEPRKNRNLPKSMVWVLALYLLFTTTVHPWYVLPLVAFSVFTTLRFPFIWSFCIIFSYVGYTATGYQENLWLVALEYVIVLSVAGMEVWSRVKPKPKEIDDEFAHLRPRRL